MSQAVALLEEMAGSESREAPGYRGTIDTGGESMADGQGILIVGELNEDGSIASVTGELLAVGRGLAAEMGQDVSCVLFGKNASERGQEAIAAGADQVYVSDHELLQEYQQEAHLAALEQVCKQVNPGVVLIGRTATGRDLAPRLAFRLGVPLMQDCVGVDVDPGSKRVVATRPVYGGNALAKVASPGDPQIVCIRAKVFEPLEPDSSRQGQVLPAQLSLDPSVVKVRQVEQVKEEVTGIQLEDARVVVSVGRGIGGPENLPVFEELAKTLGAALGASRAVCDAGWLDHSYQVGLTGKTIAPELYLTWAISGASQHMAGCSNAKNIAAINKDASANIFKEAKFGVVGEWQKVLAGFTAALNEMTSS